MCYCITPLLQSYRIKNGETKKSFIFFSILSIIITSVLVEGLTIFNPAWICCYAIGYSLGMNDKRNCINENVLVVIIGAIAILGNAAQIYCDYIAGIKFDRFEIIKLQPCYVGCIHFFNSKNNIDKSRFEEDRKAVETVR